jgi:hypothetical protein
MSVGAMLKRGTGDSRIQCEARASLNLYLGPETTQDFKPSKSRVTSSTKKTTNEQCDSPWLRSIYPSCSSLIGHVPRLPVRVGAS